MILTVFLALTFASWVYWIVALGLVRIFFLYPEEENTVFKPPVSILKPVKGLDDHAYDNFTSFCEQDYPEYEILFSITEPSDPVLEVIEEIKEDYPHLKINWCVAQNIGTNNKASQLHTLASKSRYEILVASDSDMRVTPDYLNRVVQPLSDDNTGLVTCPYRGELPETFTARLEALYMGVTFLPSVLVARKVLSMRFALGATIALRKTDLDHIGGFASISDYLADDYQIGFRIAGLGSRVHLSDYIISSVLGATTFLEQWNREVRWSLCTRISRRWEYPGLLLSFSTPLATISLFLSDFSPLGWLTLGISLFLRWTVGWSVTRYTHDKVSHRWLFCLPLRDMLSAVIWCVALFGRRVVWRGEKFTINRDGRLKKVDPMEIPIYKKIPRFILKRGIQFIDVVLRRVNHIYEFSQNEECILRLAVSENRQEISLSDGTHIDPGECVGELHFWNEHLPRMPEDGPDLAWALKFQRLAKSSLEELAGYIQTDPNWKDVKAFRGIPPFGDQSGLELLDDLLNRWGFDVFSTPKADGRLGKFANRIENYYTMGLIWLFNPESLAGKDVIRKRRDQIWISREVLINNYSDGKPIQFRMKEAVSDKG